MTANVGTSIPNWSGRSTLTISIAAHPRHPLHAINRQHPRGRFVLLAKMTPTPQANNDPPANVLTEFCATQPQAAH
jgi:hypothetical protein